MSARSTWAITAILATLATGCSTLSPEDLAIRYDDPTLDPEFALNSLPTPTDDGAAYEKSPEGRLPREVPLTVTTASCADDLTYSTQCGRITIPSTEGSTADPVEISFIRFESTSFKPMADPVIYLHGGPGGSVVGDAAQFVSTVVTPFIDERDVILYDQRGAGDSSPLPICNDAYRLDDNFFLSAIPHTELSDDYIDEISKCGRWFASNDRFDLSEINSAVHADDLVDLIGALGLAEVNLYGNSYGTRLAQTVMRDHPQHVRSVILNGVYPIESNLVGSVPEAFEAAMNQVFAACVDDPVCGPALPNPSASFVTVVDQLDQDPLGVTVATSRHSGIDLLIDGDDLINVFHGLLYTVDGAAIIADTIIDLIDGRTARLSRLGQDSIYDIADVAACLAVQCHEEVPFTTPEELEISQRTATVYERVMLPPGLLGSSLVEICQSWSSTGQASGLEDRPVSWDAPTLILSGGIDPITPPWWAQSLASRLPNATLAFSPGRGHDSSEGLCALDLMTSFVSDPETQLDTSCTAQTQAPLLNNLAERFLDGSESALVDDNFDVDPGSGVPWVDSTVPSWPVAYYETESAYWRALDSYDPTVVVIRSGPFDASELYWYLETEPEGDFSKPTIMTDLGDDWQRTVYETVGRHIVTYRRVSAVPLNISLVAIGAEIKELEQTVLLPVVHSFKDNR